MNKTPLIDSFGRTHTYLRLSVTDRCNLRCSYCMPEEGIRLKPRSEILSFDDIEQLIRIAASLGVTKVRMTGGEPLVRKDVPKLIKRITMIDGIQQVGMTTNGILLHKFLPALIDAGLSSVNISLDTLQAQRFFEITHKKEFDVSLRNIEMALESGISQVKLNVVVISGVNDDEILNFVDFARTRKMTVRFIEYMPFKDNGWDAAKMIPFAAMRSMIEERYTLVPISGSELNSSAKLFKVPGWTGTVGFITAMSNHFCDTCNRIRVTADGGIKSCLFLPESLNLRQALRNDNDDTVAALLQSALTGKPKVHLSIDTLREVITHSMVQIGG